VNELTLLAELTLPGTERSVRLARAFLRDTLVPAYVAPGDELLDDVVLVVDELAANGVRHTASGRGGTISIAVLVGDGVLRAEVTDDGAGGATPVLRAASNGESGRGLHIVDALASRWGHRTCGVRTTVWAEFPGPRAPRR
jgi:anti-sigma regulatory factor (Ser/Thr protein kinase)